jgi:hypothetical protein
MAGQTIMWTIALSTAWIVKGAQRHCERWAQARDWDL